MDSAILDGPNAYFTFFDYSVAFVAIIANCCVLAAVAHCTFTLQGYRRFLISLSASDLYVCCVNVLTLVFQICNSISTTASTFMIDHPYFNCGANVLRTLQLAGFFTNLLNLCGMSLDHFVGVVYPLKYRYYAGQNSARLAVVAIWIIAFALAFLDIPINIILYRNVAESKTFSGITGTDDENSLLSAEEKSSRSSFLMLLEPTLFGGAQSNRSHSLLQLNPPATTTTAVMSTIAIPRTFYPTYTDIDSSNEPEGSVESPTEDNVNEDDGDSEGVYPSPAHNTIGASYYGGPLATGSNNTNDTKSPSEMLNKMFHIFLLLQEEEEAKRSNETADVCTFYHETKMWFEICTMVLAIVCCVFLTISYGIVVKKVSDSADISGRRTTRKSIYTTAMLLSAFMICWMPFITFELIMLILFQRGNNYIDEGDRESVLVKSLLIQQILNSLLRTYPLIDPLIYAARIPAVQQQFVKWFLRHFPLCCGCCSRYLKLRYTPPALAVALSQRIARPSAVNRANVLKFELATYSNGHQQHIHQNHRRTASSGDELDCICDICNKKALTPSASTCIIMNRSNNNVKIHDTTQHHTTETNALIPVGSTDKSM